MTYDNEIALSDIHAPKDALQDILFTGFTSGSTGRPKAMNPTHWKISHWTRIQVLFTRVREMVFTRVTALENMLA